MGLGLEGGGPNTLSGPSPAPACPPAVHPLPFPAQIHSVMVLSFLCPRQHATKGGSLTLLTGSDVSSLVPALQAGLGASALHLHAGRPPVGSSLPLGFPALLDHGLEQAQTRDVLLTLPQEQMPALVQAMDRIHGAAAPVHHAHVDAFGVHTRQGVEQHQKDAVPYILSSLRKVKSTQGLYLVTDKIDVNARGRSPLLSPTTEILDGPSLSGSDLKQMSAKSLISPKHAAAPQYTISFDMDETLLHSSDYPNRLTLPVVMSDGYALHAQLRPHAKALISSLEGKAEMVLWTAGTQDYASVAIKHVAPSAFEHAVYRDPRWYHQALPYRKHVARLGRDMDYILHVDDNSGVCQDNRSNAIIIDAFDGNTKDQLLKKLDTILHGLLKSGKTVPQYLQHQAAKGNLVKHQDFYLLTNQSTRSRSGYTGVTW